MNIRNKNYKTSGKYESVDMGDEILLVPSNGQCEASKVIVLNQMSSVIWRYLYFDRMSLDECRKTIMAIYDVDEDVLRKDMDEFLEELINYKVMIIQE